MGLRGKLPCIPLVRAGVVLVGGLEIDLSLHKADKHSFLIDLPLELRSTWMELLSASTRRRVTTRHAEY